MEARTGTCFIGELPDELLVSIVSQIQVERGFLAETEAEEDRRCRNALYVSSLHALTLCCRKFNAIATPCLYQCVVRTDGLMTLLFQTLLQNPMLGRHIQYFEADSFYRRDPELDLLEICQRFTDPLRDEFFDRKEANWIVPDESDGALEVGHLSPRSELGGVSKSTIQRIQKQLSYSHHDAFIVLLSLMENLQDIAIDSNDHMGHVILLAYWKYSSPGKFRRLWIKNKDFRCVYYMLQYLCSDAKDSGGGLAHYLRSLFLPNDMWAELGPPPAMKEISFTSQDISCYVIERHLKNCTSLEAFSCRWQWHDIGGSLSPPSAVDLPRMYRSLVRFQHSLTRLTVDTTESAWRVDLDTVVPALGSLRNFKVLAYVDVAALVLWGDGDLMEQTPLSELLPESLEHLILKTEWDEDIEDRLYQLSSECTTSLPRLKRVECTWRPAPGFIADLLIDACHSAGVNLILDVVEPEASA